MAPGLNVELVCFPSEIRGTSELLHQDPLGAPRQAPRVGWGCRRMGFSVDPGSHGVPGEEGARS